MRIIGGSAKGRQIRAPRSRAVRPMTDYVREAIFDVLGPVDGLTVLDVYAGSGALGLEALSRGAAEATGIEKNRGVSHTIVKNLEHLGFTDRYHLRVIPVEKWLLRKENRHYDIVFVDPPYEEFDPGVVSKLARYLNSGGVLVISQSKRQEPVEAVGLELIKSRRYGEANISFYRKTQEAPIPPPSGREEAGCTSDGW